MTYEQMLAFKRWVEAAIDLKVAESQEDVYTFSSEQAERRAALELEEQFEDGAQQ